MTKLSTTLRYRWLSMIKEGEVINCGICSERITLSKKDASKRLSVDHIIPKSWGGDDIISNMQPSHAGCNNKKGNHI